MILVGLIALGTVSVFAGIMAYLGRWRRWAESSAYVFHYGFSLLYFGSGILCLTVSAAMPRQLELVDKLFVVWGPLMAVGLFSVVWLPAFMLPRWFREERAEHSEREQTIFRTRREMRARRRRQRRSL